ncbi:GNAT family N-acetyltransferase [Aeromicrobium ponti]|uniref:Acetyltransferase (GNAT) family protein n=1 Tax=Cytobacillus oceanisediminis TaxID=665099 RepID=A0A562K3V8_9BACI|nr:GNAT family N-acetyltransferase [Cytobacillus oceanisediminis]TWH89914.1 acetyltransferase (GNAT) family protein [Cytobacillus oceanisediminis]
MLNFIKDYKDYEQYRESFNTLACKVFGITFESWYRQGFWGDRYIPYSYADGNQIVANVSVNLVNLLVQGETYKAIQIGTVMTHPDYRGRGLSAGLMTKVISDYENQCDLMYLFANRSVLNFYPKFGFKPYEEIQFRIGTDDLDPSPANGVRKLNGMNSNDLKFIHEFASKRIPVSPSLAAEDTDNILMFYCSNVFNEDIYWLEDERAIVLLKEEQETLHVYDVISQAKIDLKPVLSKFISGRTKEILFHFTPGFPDINPAARSFHPDEVLFIRTQKELMLPANFKHPLTSQA